MIVSNIPSRRATSRLLQMLLFCLFSSLKIAGAGAQIGPIAIRPEFGLSAAEGAFAGIAFVNPYLAASFSMGNWGGPKTRTGAIKFYFGPHARKAEEFRKWHFKAFLTGYRTASGGRLTFSGLAVGRDFYFCPFAGLSLDIGFAGVQRPSGVQKQVQGFEGTDNFPAFSLRFWGQMVAL